jgi:ribonuclease BN (tRNA processing enzyme)
MVEFLRDVDLLIMDAQYDSAEYETHVGWGHGCVRDVVELAMEAGVKRLVLFHHDPDHDDGKVAAMAADAVEQALKAGSSLEVEAAREGSTISIGNKNV